MTAAGTTYVNGKPYLQMGTKFYSHQTSEIGPYYVEAKFDKPEDTKANCVMKAIFIPAAFGAIAGCYFPGLSQEQRLWVVMPAMMIIVAIALIKGMPEVPKK